ncbi:MAG: hypothetical protein IPJ94_07275 [Chloroflexi bacterium]|nr:hypothetical protein [Chloroflexota bacterium]
MNDKRFNENEEREPEDAVTSRPQTVEPGALITAVPDKSLSRAIGNQAMQRMAAPGKMVQRQAANETDTAVPPTTATRTPLIVPDETADLQPGQMRRAEFLAQLHTAVCQTADQSLAGTIYSAIGCPYIERWFAYYNGQDSQHIERALQRFVPETAQAMSAQSCIPLVCQRVRQGIAGWLTTGEVVGVPEGAAADLPPMDASGMPGGTAVGGLLPAAGQILSHVGRCSSNGKTTAQKSPPIRPLPRPSWAPGSRWTAVCAAVWPPPLAAILTRYGCIPTPTPDNWRAT